jgi:hypothetical protein
MSTPALSVMPEAVACSQSEPLDSKTTNPQLSQAYHSHIPTPISPSGEMLGDLPTRPALSSAAFRLMLSYPDLPTVLAGRVSAAASGNRHEFKFKKDYRKISRRQLIVDMLRMISENLEMFLRTEEKAGEVSNALTNRLAVYVGVLKLLVQSDLADCKIRQAGFWEDDDDLHQHEASSGVTGNDLNTDDGNPRGADSDAAQRQALLAKLTELGYLKSEGSCRDTA